MSNEMNGKTAELHETELEAVAGGATQNRYDPKRCSQYKRVEYECVGLFSATWCDHYSKERLLGDTDWYLHDCAMGCYHYGGDWYGYPK